MKISRTILTLIICLCVALLITSCSDMISDVLFDTIADATTSAQNTTANNVDDTTEINSDDTTNGKEPDTEVELPVEPERLNYTDVKAIWLTQFDLNDAYFSTSQREADEYREIIKKVLDNCKSIGINTVIVQVRPNADSIYPSEYFAPSKYAVAEYGNEFSYDPFEILLEEAHGRELSVHAWINPMRAMLTDEIVKIDDKYPIKKWWDNAELQGKYLSTVSDRVYLNVGYPEVRQLIIDGAAEILEKYEVDGLHLDDYFYPTTDESFDAEAYAEYGNGKSLADWRRDNLNKLVRALYEETKAVHEEILFGVSPGGNIERNYNTLYADIYTWCGSAGYVDYICPQLYFGMEHETHAFDSIADDWSQLVRDGVDMWIGVTLEKAIEGNQGIADAWAGSGQNEWINNKDVLKRCLEYTKVLDNCTGVSFFSYNGFWDTLSGEENKHSNDEVNAFLPVFKEIKWNK